MIQLFNTHCASAHVDLRQSHEFVAVRTRLYHLSQREVHPGIAIDEEAVESLAALKFHKHGMAGRRRQEAQGKLIRCQHGLVATCAGVSKPWRQCEGR